MTLSVLMFLHLFTFQFKLRLNFFAEYLSCMLIYIYIQHDVPFKHPFSRAVQVCRCLKINSLLRSIFVGRPTVFFHTLTPGFLWCISDLKPSMSWSMHFLPVILSWGSVVFQSYLLYPCNNFVFVVSQLTKRKAVCYFKKITRRPASADRTARAANFRRDLQAT